MAYVACAFVILTYLLTYLVQTNQRVIHRLHPQHG